MILNIISLGFLFDLLILQAINIKNLSKTLAIPGSGEPPELNKTL